MTSEQSLPLKRVKMIFQSQSSRDGVVSTLADGFYGSLVPATSNRWSRLLVMCHLMSGPSAKS